jgi:hypothetical protein
VRRCAALVLTLLCVACAQGGPPIDAGVEREGRYENASFDLAVTPPPGWAFVAQDEIARLVEADQPTLPTPLRRAQAKRADTTPLFAMVDRAHAPEAGRPRRAIVAQAQRVPSPPAGLTSETIATELEQGLRDVEPPIEVGARRIAIVADRRFVVVPTLVTHEGVTGRLDHYVRYEPDRLLVLSVTYPPEETAPPQAAIESIRPLATATAPKETP